jgi:hypothetical protein
MPSSRLDLDILFPRSLNNHHNSREKEAANVQRNAKDVSNNPGNPAKSQEDGPAHAREIP